MSAARRVALVDSGLGGLTVLSELRSAMPDLDVIYFADTAHVPYGDRPLAEVAQLGRRMIEWLADYEPALVIVASGTTCAAFESVGWQATRIPQLGIVAVGAAAGVAASNTHNIGVIATRGTIESGIFERKIHALQPAAVVTSVAAPALVPIVEAGEWASEQARLAVEQSVGSIRTVHCDTLILGCTHFPHLMRWFSGALQAGVAIVDPAEACAAAAMQMLHEYPQGHAQLVFAVSGDVDDFARHALQLSGFVANDTRQVELGGERVMPGGKV